MPLVPKFHDDYLTGIQLLPEKQCRLTIEHWDGGTSHVLLSGIQHFRADDFWEGNIIFDLEIANPEYVRETDICDMLGLDETRPSEHVERCLKSLKGGESILVTISPSYGCHLRCLCTSCELESCHE